MVSFLIWTIRFDFVLMVMIIINCGIGGKLNGKVPSAVVNVVICLLVYYFLLAQTSDAAIEELNQLSSMLNDKSSLYKTGEL